MGLYNFQPRFAEAVISGSKTHTIRGRRATPDKPGNLLYLYTGLRKKGAKLLLRSRCTKIEQINISDGAGFVEVRINGVVLWMDECEQLAKRDGFASFADMMAFWKGRLPFDGHIIHWKFLGEVE